MQKCKKCGSNNKIDVSFASEGIGTCRHCSASLVLTANAETHYAITSVNRSRILQLVNRSLSKTMGAKSCIFDRASRSWLIRTAGTQIPVFLSQVSSFNHYFDVKGDSQWLCILTDWEGEKSIVNYYNEAHFVAVEDVLAGKADLSEMLMVLTHTYAPNPVPELSHRFRKFISSVTPTEFEHGFVDSFIRSLKEKSAELAQYINFLTSMRRTIVNTKVLQIGGPGKQDFISLDLLEYLQEGLKPTKVGEAKRYCTTRFTIQDFGVAQVHAQGADTVYLVSTNDIQPEVWSTIWDTYRHEGRFKQVIFDLDIIILLVKNLGLEALLNAT